ncbi:MULTISPECIES: TetR/AcrR family transcriptional regulator [Corynebacterium]|uniref:TetR/AcrR family transcriptional regulator n=1 Tax=Corynebacterium TaxID=1716 RepID=UPI00124C51A2|nr:MULTISPECIES: TetR/AcrR family transcriptional regulator [Corynebacterium]MBV7280907.1 TetR/AcrR family transcriptional regulator [Corynebacterium sp. TAE3-ERU30]MBV7302633.1 TetR/AcrR family transcriptional regulator [Corynebacterium sp. TAE3-ERU2]
MPRVSSSDLNRRRQGILDAARACFAQHGYEGATVRRLEEATGKSRGAIFHHFNDKEHLFLALAREDAARMAEVTAREGLVEVMRDMLHHPERYDWLSTRLEISRMLRTDPHFRSLWQQHQAVLDEAVRSRLSDNASRGRMRDDVEVDVLMVYLETFMDGFISQLVSGQEPAHLEQVLNLIEETIRGR